MRIYVASSWRNDRQPAIVARLRTEGHEVYDFRNPRPGEFGFAWSDIDEDWQEWTPQRFGEALLHPTAVAGFASDMEALADCDACVLVNPSGRSAHLEAGWAAGAGKELIILLADGDEPELMYRMAGHLCVDVEQVVQALNEIDAGRRVSA